MKNGSVNLADVGEIIERETRYIRVEPSDLTLMRQLKFISMQFQTRIIAYRTNSRWNGDDDDEKLILSVY